MMLERPRIENPLDELNLTILLAFSDSIKEAVLKLLEELEKNESNYHLLANQSNQLRIRLEKVFELFPGLIFSNPSIIWPLAEPYQSYLNCISLILVKAHCLMQKLEPEFDQAELSWTGGIEYYEGLFSKIDEQTKTFFALSSLVSDLKASRKLVNLIISSFLCAHTIYFETFSLNLRA